MKSGTKPFWNRQFDAHPTEPQVLFDVFLGVVAPIMCVVADPIVFREDNQSPLTRYQPFAWAFVAVSVVTLVLWTVFQTRLKAGAGFFAGALLCGGSFAFVVGIAILPFSLVGLAFLIGIPGFTPFATSLSFVRAGVRALRRARANAGMTRVTVLALLGAAVWVIPSVAFHEEVTGAFKGLMDNPRSDVSIARAERAKPFYSAGVKDVAVAFERQTDPARKRHLARAFAVLTGRDLEEELRRIND